MGARPFRERYPHVRLQHHVPWHTRQIHKERRAADMSPACRGFVTRGGIRRCIAARRMHRHNLLLTSSNRPTAITRGPGWGADGLGFFFFFFLSSPPTRPYKYIPLWTSNLASDGRFRRAHPLGGSIVVMRRDVPGTVGTVARWCVRISSRYGGRVR